MVVVPIKTTMRFFKSPMINSYPGTEIVPFSPPLPAPPWDTWLSLSFSPSHAEVRLHASQGRLFFSSRGGNSAGRNLGWQEGSGRRCGKAKKARQGRAGLGLEKDTRATEELAEEAEVTREISRLGAGTGRFRRATVALGLARLAFRAPPGRQGVREGKPRLALAWDRVTNNW